MNIWSHWQRGNITKRCLRKQVPKLNGAISRKPLQLFWPRMDDGLFIYTNNTIASNLLPNRDRSNEEESQRKFTLLCVRADK